MRAFLLILCCLFLFGCHRIGAPPSKTPYGPEGAEAGADAPYNRVANGFLLDLQDGRLAEARSRASEGYRQRVPLDAFQKQVQSHPFPDGAGTVLTTQKTPAGNRREFTYQCRGSGGQLSFTFTVMKEGEKYEVGDLVYE